MENSRPQEPPLISVENLVKCYDGVTVLNGISLDIEPGALVSLIGPSGCGKTTLLRCLNCLEILDAGTITIGGVTLERAPNAGRPDSHSRATAHVLRAEVGMVFQSFNLFPHKTLLQNVILAPLVVKGKARDVAEADALRLLDKVGLGQFKDRYPHALSGGQQQRAAIARALAMAPKVMLYDEPTSALDPERVEEVLQVMRDLHAEGMTQLVVTHEMRFARSASDHVVYMEHGQIVEVSNGDEIFTDPKDERTRRFLRQFMGK